MTKFTYNVSNLHFKINIMKKNDLTITLTPTQLGKEFLKNIYIYIYILFKHKFPKPPY